ncbi:MAG: hypothetical protein U9N51_00145 [Bacteroidota bacterium]|nr:hypothetical protein [Bacteroidota bacterium]
MKKQFLILMSLMLFVLFSCEDKNELVENAEKYPIAKATVINNDPDRFFDAKYTSYLENISNTTVLEVSKSKELEGYYLPMNSLNECFFDALLDLPVSELNQIDIKLQNAKALIEEGYESEGLQMLSDINTDLGCITDVPLIYKDEVYQIPIYEIEEILGSVDRAIKILLVEFPGLKKLNENQFDDFLVIAYLNTTINTKLPETCCSAYRGSMLSIKNDLNNCIDISSNLLMKTLCSVDAAIRGLIVTNTYNNCVDDGGTGC